MILTLKTGAAKKDVEKIIAKIKDLGFKPQVSTGAERVVIGVIGENAILHKDKFETLDAVEMVTPISKPYKVVSREFKKEPTIVQIGKNVKIGGKQVVIVGGPCSVDTRQNLLENARDIKKSGGTMLRGGAFKPRTSPYAFQGLGEK
ncbi:MAG: 3-deoxy-7-phosphoheptulonate synthase, partial [Elusimicrobia bacterium]|nr:3-deoxy-7-phosphoheptulonate synthase [Elusimicrobiota bacterium]